VAIMFGRLAGKVNGKKIVHRTEKVYETSWKQSFRRQHVSFPPFLMCVLPPATSEYDALLRTRNLDHKISHTDWEFWWLSPARPGIFQDTTLNQSVMRLLRYIPSFVNILIIWFLNDALSITHHTQSNVTITVNDEM
jgi:hypothetical protein